MKKSPFLSVQPIPRDLKTMFPYQQQAGLLTYISSQKITFPVSQFPSGVPIFCSMITVTRSHRIFTCFPFNFSRQSDFRTCYLLFSSFLIYHITIQNTRSFPIFHPFYALSFRIQFQDRKSAAASVHGKAIQIPFI